MQQQNILFFIILLTYISAEFVSVPQEQIPKSFALKIADELGIKYTPIAYNNNKADLPCFQNSYDAIFLNLSEQQFNQLKQQYGAFSKTKSKVIYQKNHNQIYYLSDFLPPLMQATQTLHFHTQYHNYTLPKFVKGQESSAINQKTQLTINCWGTVYDLLLSFQDEKDYFTISVADPKQVWQVLSDDESSQLIYESFNSKETPKNVQPGDYILIYHQNNGQDVYLDHTAILIDENLYFERAGSGDNVPFRLNVFSDLASEWIPGVFKYQWRRSKLNLKKQSEIFGLKTVPIDYPQKDKLKSIVRDQFCVSLDFQQDGSCDSNTYIWIKDVDPYVYSLTGRATLPKSSYNPVNLELTKITDDIYEPSLFLQ